jgi:hypothetical protein
MDSTTASQDRVINSGQIKEPDGDDSESGVDTKEFSIARERLINDMGYTNLTTALVIDIAFRNYASGLLSAVKSKSKTGAEPVLRGINVDSSVEKHTQCVACAMCQCRDEKIAVHRPNNGNTVRPVHHEGLKFGFCQDPPCPTCWILLSGTKRMLGLEPTSKKESFVALFLWDGRVEEVRVADDLGSLCSGGSPSRLQFYTEKGVYGKLTTNNRY